MQYQEEEYIEDDQEVVEEEINEGGKKNKLKLFLPLILLAVVLLVFGGYYYMMQLASTTGGTPVAQIPEPTDTTVTGDDNIDQVALADAQLNKNEREAGMKEEKPTEQEVTRVDFSAKKQAEKKQPEPVDNKPIDNVPATVPIERVSYLAKPVKRAHPRSITKPVVVPIKLETTPKADGDPFNIILGTKQTRKPTRQATEDRPQPSANEEYAKYQSQFSSASQSEEPVPGIIYGQQKIVAGQTVAIKLEKNLVLNGATVKSGTIVYGLPMVDNGRINIKISNIKNGTSLIRTNLLVLGEDMNEGVRYSVKGGTDMSGTKGQIVDAATSRLGTVGNIIGSLGRNSIRNNEAEYWLQSGKRVYVIIN